MGVHNGKIMLAVAEGAVAAHRDPVLALATTRFWAPLSLTPNRNTASTPPSNPDAAIAAIKPYLDAGRYQTRLLPRLRELC